MSEERPSRRKVPRVPRRERLYVRILESDRHPGLKGTTARCTTANVSSGGLRLALDYPVEVGTRLDLWAKLPEHPGTFLLTGEVRWAMAGDLEDEHILGIELVPDGDAPDADLAEWQHLLSALARHP
ncbi:MAG: PilZ domain-containing protein [Gammaproteobacteria bacterium]|nr:PilZ domain-containing protein [Gammaproteobacteria bacterium]